MADELSSAPPDPFLGRRINNLIVKSRLAEGGMGVVYLAQHERLQNLRGVIKFLLPEYAHMDSIRQRFVQEAEAAAKLRHDNIVKIVDHGTLDDGHCYLVMEHLEGETLDEYLRRSSRLDVHRAFGIVAQIASALQHVHDHGIVHRDLKPSNIFLTRLRATPRVVLLDFGIAKDLEARSPLATHTGMALGTPAYMAVEQHEDSSRVSPAADVFSLGVLTWQLLTGELPWSLHSASVLYRMQREVRPSAPPESVMPREVAVVLQAALAADPRARPQSAREFAIELASAIPAIPPHAPSGAEILSRVASDLVIDTPHDLVTLQHSVGQGLLAPSDARPRHRGRWRRGLRATVLAASTALATYALTRLVSAPEPAASRAAHSPAPAATHAAPDGGVPVTPPDASPGSTVPAPVAASPAPVAASPAPVAASPAPIANPKPAVVPPRPPAPVNGVSGRRTGELVVRVPTWAEVYVDGKYVGQAPLRVTVPVGRHDVLLIHDEHRETASIDVTSTREAIIQPKW